MRNKNYIYEWGFDFSLDQGFWALPFSICYIPMPAVRSLVGGGAIILRCLCFSLGIELWKWDEEVTDINDSVGVY